jgi:hypothetical protein
MKVTFEASEEPRPFSLYADALFSMNSCSKNVNQEIAFGGVVVYIYLV